MKSSPNSGNCRDSHQQPKGVRRAHLGIDVVEVVDTGILEVVSNEVELEDLLSQHTHTGEHADTAVLDLRLTPLLDDGLGRVSAD